MRKIKKISTIIRVSVKRSLSFRMQCVISFISSIFSVVFLYFLWSIIYLENGSSIAELDFKHTFTFVAVASILNVIFRTTLVYENSDAMIQGRIATEFIRPYNFYLYTIYKSIGYVIPKIILIGVPTITVICFLNGMILQDLQNFVFFILSAVLGLLISINIDYTTSLVAFKTESLWGVNMLKETIICVFSGMIVPLEFYPDKLMKVLQYTPLISIYNIPVNMLGTRESTMDCFARIVIQVAWNIIIIIFNQYITKIAVSKASINGG